MQRIRRDGKFFAAGEERFTFRGVCYGTFEPRPIDGARVPEQTQIKRDLFDMQAAGFNVVRTYTAPPDDMLDIADELGIRVLAGVAFEDWRYTIGASAREFRRVAKQAEAHVRETAQRLAGRPEVFGMCLGNEIPADVLRWHGEDQVAKALGHLVDVVHEIDPDMLVTYAGYPTAEYLNLPEIDFVTFNVFLEEQPDFRKYLTRLHHLAGDRPLVLGEMGLHSDGTYDGDQAQATAIAWQMETAIERGVAGMCIFSWTDEWYVGDETVEGWNFGITDIDRLPKPSFDVAVDWNTKDVTDLDHPWPKISVVVCAYNEEQWIEECLTHATTMQYPDFEVLLMDDGSTDRTVEIANAIPGTIVHELPHAGLSVARNEGYRRASGEVVAYLDADAYPSQEWLYYLALAYDGPTVGGVGGPNIPPSSDGAGARVVARAPGGPVHVLMADDRAEHIPGCNMSFYRKVLTEVGGCDPVYMAAGDDVDLCWRILDRGWDIGFHPAALVWHHRRTGLKTYLKQQRGYGRAEALVEARHPDRFTPTGSARWRGNIYGGAPSIAKQRIYRGQFGSAAFQSVYQGGGYLIDLLHQVGVPFVGAIAVLAAVLTPISLWFGAVACFSGALLLTLFVADVWRTNPAGEREVPAWKLRLLVATHHLLQPLARMWGRLTSVRDARRDMASATIELPPIYQRARKFAVVAEDRPRAELVGDAVTNLRADGHRVRVDHGWERHDAQVGGYLTNTRLQTSAHPPGFVQFRFRQRLDRARLTFVAAVFLMAMALSPSAGAGIAVLAAAALGRDLIRARGLLDKVGFADAA